MSTNPNSLVEKDERIKSLQNRNNKVEFPPITKLHHSFNVNLSRFGNLYIVEKQKLVTSSGNTLVFFDLENGQFSFLKGEGHDGIGAMCVFRDEGTKEVFITVGNRGNFPSVFIHSYPDMKIVKELKKGTETSFTAMCFNQTGSQLATVGYQPDFMLTIWDWRKGTIILRCKAFGQDVFKVAFNPWLKGNLTSSGVGHIKFWKMSQTFTGLKLQGQVGKFGKVDISDIVGFVQFPDGKVLSGSEQGHLILWEENLVKVVFVVKANELCHDGMISIVKMANEKRVMSCGYDSYIKFWDFERIDTSEPSDTSYVVEITPLEVIKVGDNVKIVNLLSNGDDEVIVQDANGGIWTQQIGKTSAKKVFSFLSGRINAVDSSPTAHLTVAGGEDGKVVLVNHHSKEILYTRQFNSEVSCLVWNSLSVDSSGRTITVGFKDGVVRFLRICSDGFELLNVLKPHNSEVTSVEFSLDGNYFSSSDYDGNLWFFKNQKDFKLGNVGFCRLHSPVSHMIWEEGGLIVSLLDSTIMMVTPPPESRKESLTRNSFEIFPETKQYQYFQYLRPPKREIKKRKIVNEFGEEVEEVDEEAEQEEQRKEKLLRESKFPVLCIQKSRAGGLYVSLKKENGFYRYSGMAWESEKQKEKEYPLCCLTRVNAVCSTLNESKKGTFMAVGYENGKIRLITTSDDNHNFTIDCHDSHSGRISGLCTSFDESYFVSVSVDGCFFIQDITQIDPQPSSSPAIISDLGKIGEEEVNDISDSGHWSIEESRIKSAEMELHSRQDSIKEDREKKILNLKNKFQRLLKENRNFLSRDSLQLDRSLQKQLEEKYKGLEGTTKKKMEWITEKVLIGKKKLEAFYIDDLDYERIVVHGFNNGIKLSSFKTRKLYDDLSEEIMKIQQIIKEEMEKQEMARKLKAERRITSEKRKTTRTKVTKSSKLSVNKKRSRKGSTFVRTYEKSMKKAEELQKIRKELEIARNELKERKSKVHEVDPLLQEKISRIEADMGDFKLRMDENYVAPLEHRMTTQKKFTQLILLEESMHSLKVSFNHRLIDLRNLKGELIEKFEIYNKQIFQINKELGIKEPPIHEVIFDDEFPEKRVEISNSDIEEYKVFKKEMEKHKEIDRGQMIFDRRDDASVKFSQKSKGPVSVHKTVTDTTSRISGSVTGGALRSTREEILESLPVSNVENSFSEVQKISKLYEKQRLLERKNRLKTEFDESLEDFREEKFMLEADLESAELKLLLLKSEYELLKQFEIKDQRNYRQLNEKKQVKSRVLMEIQQCQNELLKKRREIKNLVRQEKVSIAFDRAVSGNHPAYEELKDIFNRSDKDNQSVYSDDSESDDDEEMEEISKPEKCSEELFQTVLELRSQKVKQDEQIDGISKSVEKLKKKREQLGKLKRNADTALEQINVNIQNVQKEKQSELNKLILLVVLKLGQIKSLIQRRIPKILSHYVVFTNQGLHSLAQKEKEILLEIEKDRKGNHRLRNKLKSIRNHHKNIKDELYKIKEKVKEFQLLKFGQEVEYEQLILTLDPKTQELREELLKLERNGEKLHKGKLKEINTLKERLSTVTKENTKFLNSLADLREKQERVETEINEAQDTMIDRIYKGMENQGIERLKKMKRYLLFFLLKNRIVLDQARRIENFRNEVAILRSKSTHVYSEL